MHTSGVYYRAISEVLVHHNREKSSEQELRSLHLLLTGTVYVTSSASSPQWSLKTCRCVILPASIWWMNYRKMLVDTCKERLSDETRAVMGLGKEETPPPASLPHTSTLPWPLRVTFNPSSFLPPHREPYAFPFPSFSFWAPHLDVKQIPLRKSYSSRRMNCSCFRVGGSTAKQILANCHSLPVASIHIWDYHINSICTTYSLNAAQILWIC